MKRKYLALILAGVMALSMTACGGGSTSSEQPADGGAAAADDGAGTDAAAPAASGDVVTINVGYENATTEPAAKAVEKWKELVEEKSGGSIALELFPNSALGKKTDLIDQMIMEKM